MLTRLFTANVKLNPKKEARRCLIVDNKDNGILIIDEGLFSISFESTADLMKSDVIITNKIHIVDIIL